MTSRRMLPVISHKMVVAFSLAIISLCTIQSTFGLSVKTSTSTSTTNSKVNIPVTNFKSNMESRKFNFGNAGKKAGLEIWRVEDFSLVPYPISDYGKFYSGDSYVVLSTKENKGTFSYDIHYWQGKETTQDESGAAAIYAAQLDDSLGGVPVQYRETQEHESKLFLSYFKNHVRYLPGGVASGFRHATINPTDPKKLYQVKGKKNVRVVQVKLDVSEMNHGDCYILDSSPEIYIFCGEKAKHSERLIATKVANQIRDEDHKGRGHVTKIEIESSTPDEIQSFFNVLGSGSIKGVAQPPTIDDDEAFEKKQDEIVSLYKIISDSGGLLKTEKVSTKPLTKSLLKPDHCFILDTVRAGIYVWVGKKCTNAEKNEAMKKADQFIKQNNYPAYIQVTRVVGGAEPAAFKHYFIS